MQKLFLLLAVTVIYFGNLECRKKKDHDDFSFDKLLSDLDMSEKQIFKEELVKEVKKHHVPKNKHPKPKQMQIIQAEKKKKVQTTVSTLPGVCDPICSHQCVHGCDFRCCIPGYQQANRIPRPPIGYSLPGACSPTCSPTCFPECTDQCCSGGPGGMFQSSLDMKYHYENKCPNQCSPSCYPQCSASCCSSTYQYQYAQGLAGPQIFRPQQMQTMISQPQLSLPPPPINVPIQALPAPPLPLTPPVPSLPIPIPQFQHMISARPVPQISPIPLHNYPPPLVQAPNPSRIPQPQTQFTPLPQPPLQPPPQAPPTFTGFQIPNMYQCDASCPPSCAPRCLPQCCSNALTKSKSVIQRQPFIQRLNNLPQISKEPSTNQMSFGISPKVNGATRKKCHLSCPDACAPSCSEVCCDASTSFFPPAIDQQLPPRGPVKHQNAEDSDPIINKNIQTFSKPQIKAPVICPQDCPDSCLPDCSDACCHPKFESLDDMKADDSDTATHVDDKKSKIASQLAMLRRKRSLHESST